MRTKTLLVTAALGAVSIATSMAQVYSVNAVGYVNLTLPASLVGPPTKGSIIANPLNGTNNSPNTVLPLSADCTDSIIYRYNTATHNYDDAITFYFESGWFAGFELDGVTLKPLPDLAPGEAFWFFPVNLAGPTLNVTFVGEVPQGPALSNPLPAAGYLSMRSSIVPQAAAIGNATTAGTLLFPAERDDLVYIFDNTVPGFKDTYQYYVGDLPEDYTGWFSASDPSQAGPIIPVATGFFVQKAATATQTAWTRSFSVNP